MFQKVYKDAKGIAWVKNINRGCKLNCVSKE